MSDAKPTVLLAPGLGGLRRLFESAYTVLDLPQDGVGAFAKGVAPAGPG